MAIYDTRPFLDGVAAARAYCAAHDMGNTPVILCGHPRSGNTLVRFIFHNWIRAANSDARQTLSYSELNRANPNAGFPDGLAAFGFIEPQGIDHRGFPLMLHGHASWSRRWRDR